jgi:hypothetical protein
MSYKSIQQKNFFLSDVQVAFFVAQNTENEFAWSFDSLKHNFDFHQCRFLRRPEARL